MTTNLQERLSRIEKQIRQAATSCGRDPDDITLVAVTKTQPVTLINQAIGLGVHHIGESRIQEARERLPEVSKDVTRHLIGHLQRNKVKYAVKLFDMIQSVDSIGLAEEINARCSKMGKQIPVLIEVNTSDEQAKIGCAPSEALTLMSALDRLPHLSVRGFMTVAANSDDEEIVRGCFRKLRDIFEKAKQQALVHGVIDTLSMGMTSDFVAAIEEGATMVRIGSAIFGPREG